MQTQILLSLLSVFVSLALLPQNLFVVGKDTNDKKLNVLLMVPCFPKNWSHVNYAFSLYMTIRKEHNIRFVVLYGDEIALRFLKELSGKDGYKEEIELFDMSKSEKMVDVKQADDKVISRKFGEGINDDSDFVQQMALFPHMWIDYMERHGYLRTGNGAPSSTKNVLPRFDVGIAELFMASQHAFAVFHALGIPHCIPIRAMSPSAQQLEDLSLLGWLYDGNIPPLEKTEFGDHIRRATTSMTTSERKNLGKLYRDVSRKDKTSIDAIDHELFIGKLPGFEDFDLRKMFRQASVYFYNTRPQLEFDGGKVLGKVKRLKMVAGIHVKERNELKKGRTLLNRQIDQKIEHITKDIAGGFAGIVLISFGTVLLTTEPKKMSAVHFEALKTVIVAHPNNLFVWKLSTDDPRIAELNKTLPNVYSADWVDQQAILSHPDTRAFVSHCGRNSQFEAAYFGVPLICVPFFADQYYNAESTARQRLGSVLNFFCVEVHGKQYSIKFSKLSGSMELDTEEIKYRTVDDLHTKFLKSNIDKKVKEQNVLKLLEPSSDECFTPANINKKLDEAFGTGQQPISLDRQHLAKVKEELRQNPAQELVLRSLKEILEMKIKDANAKTSAAGGSRSRSRRRSRPQRRRQH